MVQTIQYTQRVQNLPLHFVDKQTTFHVMYSLKMQIVKKFIVLRPAPVKMLFIAIFSTYMSTCHMYFYIKMRL